MKLTKKEAIEICKELWTFLAETGKEKFEWDGWKKYGEMENDCPFCEYCRWQDDWLCESCPYYKMFGTCDDDGKPYNTWDNIGTKQGRKKYAKEFLAQLEQLK